MMKTCEKCGRRFARPPKWAFSVWERIRFCSRQCSRTEQRYPTANETIDLEKLSIPEPMSGCWLWLGYTMDGYGRIKSRGRPIAAHRLSYERYKGPIPPGMVIRHQCDTPSCVNPDHLTVGTRAQNTADRDERNRTAHGTQSAKAKLTPEIVREIRSSHESDAELGRKYGVTPHTVRYARLGLNWKRVE